MKRSIDRTQGKALKKTPFRSELLQIFKSASGPLSAAQLYEILAKARKIKSIKFDRATLFRNLKTLVATDILSSTEFGTGATYYCINSQKSHHHHVFCTECKVVKSVEGCVIAPLVAQANRMGFQVHTHRLELLGLCAECV